MTGAIANLTRGHSSTDTLRAVSTAVPQRVLWAVETLAVQPGDRVLEIGCGSGVAVAMICDRLVEGRMLAIDRSSVQIERGRRRNEPHFASGRLSLEAVELADLDVGEERFDKVLAINVNPFWLGPATAELAAVRRAMAPGGRLFLVYEAPGPEGAREGAERLAAVLDAEGFEQVERHVGGPTLVASVFRPRT
jgi:cyclopropane fatty-acyl-phospholipid synthase-like methyltransferase